MLDLIGGSPVVWVLLCMSLAALTIILLKIWQLVQLRPEKTDELETALRYWLNGSKEEAVEKASSKEFGSDILIRAMQGVQDSAVEEAALREDLERIALLKLNDLRALLPALEGIATLSPLLGLLGTVIGMIDAFQAMESAGSRVDPSVLSAGIWQALLTTAIGLTVAIPTLAIYTWLDRKVQRVASWLNDVLTRIFTSMHGVKSGE